MERFTIQCDKLVDVLKFDPTNPLLFNTGLFLLLFVFLLLIYKLLRKARTLRMIVVILFSLYFYYKSSAEYCFILLGVCVSDYVIGRLMEGSAHRWQQRCLLLLNILLNVGMLVYFKYLNLLIDTVREFTTLKFDALDIILPAGISFFAFRSISYIVDIYRGDIKACRNFLDYTFFLTFFPPLLMGPVVRAKDMLPQIAADRVATRTQVTEGLFLIMAGLVKKVVVADFISGNFVDRVFDNPALYSGFENIMAIYGFTIQLYCDFSGYSDIAIGIALLLGFRFKDNFRAPFKSQSPTEFWHRWHISLSSWLRDYVYIPLGGNRCGHLRHGFNLMATMVIGGLWHGASWMFMIWGALHGAFLVAHKEIKRIFPVLDREKKQQRWRVALNIFVTFNIIAFTFMFFRAESLTHVSDMTHQIINEFHIEVAPQFFAGYLTIMLAMLFGYVIHFLPRRWTVGAIARYKATPLVVQALILALVILLIIQVRQSDIVPFLYLKY